MSMTMKLPLPRYHWLTKRGINTPPMPFRIGKGTLRDALVLAISEAARHAIRGATLNGKDLDFDPDAMVQNFVVGMLGYFTDNGLSSEKWQNPTYATPVFTVKPNVD